VFIFFSIDFGAVGRKRDKLNFDDLVKGDPLIFLDIP